MNNFFLLHRSWSRRDPLVKVCDNIINEVVKESTAQLVHSAVDEVVVGHMAVIKSGDWLEDFILETIQPMLPRVVGEYLSSVYASEVTCNGRHKLLCLAIYIYLFSKCR